MSCSKTHEMPCSQVLNSLLLLLDGEIEEISRVQAIENHLHECPPCRSEVDHERYIHKLLHDLLTRSCSEVAPPELHEEIAAHIAASSHAGVSQITTEFRMTEISIQVEDFLEIEHREIYIERTQEFRSLREE